MPAIVGTSPQMSDWPSSSLLARPSASTSVPCITPSFWQSLSTAYFQPISSSDLSLLDARSTASAATANAWALEFGGGDISSRPAKRARVAESVISSSVDSAALIGVTGAAGNYAEDDDGGGGASAWDIDAAALLRGDADEGDAAGTAFPPTESPALSGRFDPAACLYAGETDAASFDVTRALARAHAALGAAAALNTSALAVLSLRAIRDAALSRSVSLFCGADERVRAESLLALAPVALTDARPAAHEPFALASPLALTATAVARGGALAASAIRAPGMTVVEDRVETAFWAITGPRCELAYSALLNKTRNKATTWRLGVRGDAHDAQRVRTAFDARAVDAAAYMKALAHSVELARSAGPLVARVSAECGDDGVGGEDDGVGNDDDGGGEVVIDDESSMLCDDSGGDGVAEPAVTLLAPRARAPAPPHRLGNASLRPKISALSTAPPLFATVNGGSIISWCGDAKAGGGGGEKKRVGGVSFSLHPYSGGVSTVTALSPVSALSTAPSPPPEPALPVPVLTTLTVGGGAARRGGAVVAASGTTKLSVSERRRISTEERRRAIMAAAMEASAAVDQGEGRDMPGCVVRITLCDGVPDALECDVGADVGFRARVHVRVPGSALTAARCARRILLRDLLMTRESEDDVRQAAARAQAVFLTPHTLIPLLDSVSFRQLEQVRSKGPAPLRARGTRRARGSGLNSNTSRN